ncbi:unnamed protein product [Citrullus colocynthis]|uniref:Uncharacterized protein n=1 Tax=Citrullus colocynthis TaxID=252529 RepID=A0ABP0Z5Q7_9ROSI
MGIQEYMADKISAINRKFDIFKYFTEEWARKECKIETMCKKMMPYSTATNVSHANINRLKQHVADILSGTKEST